MPAPSGAVSAPRHVEVGWGVDGGACATWRTGRAKAQRPALFDRKREEMVVMSQE